MEDGVQPEGEFFNIASENTTWAIFDGLPEQGLLEARFHWQPGNMPIDFGIGLHMEKEEDNGYFFRFEPGYNRMVFDLWPRGNINGEQHRMGGDIPYVPAFERRVDYLGNEISIKLLIEQDICIIYVNDRTAMSARVCSIKDNWGFFATGGTVSVTDVSWCFLQAV